jgi:lipopolysaccharide export system protein LptA
MANPGPASAVTIHPSNLASNQAIRLLAVATGVNVNATGDQAVLPIINSTNYSVSNVVFTNGSISLSSAAAGLFTAPTAGGTGVVANAALSALTGPTVVSQRTVASTATQSGQNLYLNVGTAQGAAATMDVYVYGYDFSTY